MSSAMDDLALGRLLSSAPKALERAQTLCRQLRLSTGPSSANELDSFCTPALPAIAALLACKACVLALLSLSLLALVVVRPEDRRPGAPLRLP